jgi:hypothetical protein
MPNKSIAGLTLALLAVAGCGQDTLAPQKMASEPSLAAVAGGVELNSVDPISLALLVPCANGGVGEMIQMDGFLHTVLNATIDNQGGVHEKYHYQPQNLSGTGLDTGDKYEGTGVTQDQVNTVVGAEETFVNNFRMIGAGPGNNYSVHENIHITVNANGTVTASHDNLSITCK